MYHTVSNRVYIPLSLHTSCDFCKSQNFPQDPIIGLPLLLSNIVFTIVILDSTSMAKCHILIEMGNQISVLIFLIFSHIFLNFRTICNNSRIQLINQSYSPFSKCLTFYGYRRYYIKCAIDNALIFLS